MGKKCNNCHPPFKKSAYGPDVSSKIFYQFKNYAYKVYVANTFGLTFALHIEALYSSANVAIMGSKLNKPRKRNRNDCVTV